MSILNNLFFFCAILMTLRLKGFLASNSAINVYEINLHKIFPNNVQNMGKMSTQYEPDKNCDPENTETEISSKISPRVNNRDCNSKSILVPKCGIRQDGLIARVVNGKETEVFEFPWIVVILKLQKNPITSKHLFLCSGSLIHPSIILTIAHCVNQYKDDYNNLKIRAGEWDITSTDEIIPNQDRFVNKVIVHENFKKASMVNDIALIITKEPFTLGRNINPICLPNFHMNFENVICTTAGWGKDNIGSEGNYKAILNKIDLPIVPNSECQRRLRVELGANYNLNPSFTCAGGEIGKDACKGDGGSPLMCNITDKKSQYYQVGSVSWGVGCGGETPGVYSNIAFLRDWIDEKVTYEGYTTQYYTNI